MLAAAIAAGLFIGSIGTDPSTAADRFTFGWFYLADGIQLVPLLAGLFAIPEILWGYNQRQHRIPRSTSYIEQSLSGDAGRLGKSMAFFPGRRHRRFDRALPGLGGAIADWMAYSQTVASNPGESFGGGNIKGVIGPEGANNAQKASSMVPTVLFGIPGAPFAAVLIGLFSFLNFELGSIYLLEDQMFFNSMSLGFLGATIIVMAICLLLNRYLHLISAIPYRYYSVVVLGCVIWASVQYTGGWEDYVILVLASALGIACKKYHFSRPSLLVAFILSDRVEALTVQVADLYTLSKLMVRPGFVILLVLVIILLFYSFKKGGKIDFS